MGALLLCLLCLLGTASPLQANDQVHLHLKWYHQYQFAGYYMAQSRGLYAEHGLDVTIHEYEPAKETVNAVLEGEGAYGVGGSELLLEYAKGRPVVALAAIFQHSPSVLMSLARSSIHSPQDLKGKRIMMSSQSEPELWAMLIKQGISPTSLELAPTTWDIGELIRGEVDAMAAYSTNSPYLLREQGLSYILMRPRTYGVDFYGDCLFTSQQELTNHPDRVRRFREASLQGWEYALEHPDEAIELLREEYGVKKERRHLEFEARNMRQLVLPDLVRVGHMNPNRWEAIAETYVLLDMLQPDYDLDGFLFVPGFEQHSPWLRVTLMLLGSLVAVALLAAIWLTVFNRRLRSAVRKRTAELEREIVERKRAESQTYESRRRLEDALEAMGAGVAIYDAEDRLVICNRLYRSFYPPIAHLLQPGVTYEEVIRAYVQTGPEHLAGRDPETFVQNKLRQHESPGPATDSYVAGRWLSVVDRKTSEGGLVSLRYDLSEQYRVRDELRRAKSEADEASRSKSDFLARMSHEIRTPMNACLGMLGLLRTTPLDKPQQEYLDKAMNASRDLLELIDEILDFSKVEAGKVELEKTPFKLSRVLQSVVGLFEDKAANKGVQLILQRGEDVPEMLVGDGRRLSQIIINLMSNAVKFTPEGGRVILRVECREIRLDEAVLEFSVQDTGIGIPPHLQDRIFRAFTQSDGSMTRKYGGTGLGLSISRRLVEMMGGTLAVDSREGEGASLSFSGRFGRVNTADARKQELDDEATALQLPATVSTLLRGELVLVVEDSRLNRELVREILELAGAEVVEAVTGTEGLKLVEDQDLKFSAVIMDVQMPELDGYEATRAIRDLVSSDLPVLGISAHAFDSAREKGLESGMNAYLVKPIQAEELLRELAELLDRDTEPLELGEVEAPELQEFREMFAQRFADAGERLAFFLDSGETGAAARLAHELAGVSGTIDENELGERSRELERLIAEEGISQLPPGYLDTLEQALGRCRQGGITETTTRDNRQLAELLTRLRRHLLSNEHVDSELLAQAQNVLSGSVYERVFSRISLLVAEIEYQRALDELDELLREMPLEVEGR